MESLSLCCYCRDGERLVNYAENMRSQSGFRISEFQHRIGGTKPRQSLTRRAKFDEMCDVTLHWTSVHFENK